jgi:LSD1 subclass zinc finger protein
MTRLLPLLLLLSSSAWADTASSVAVSDSTPTVVPASPCNTCRSLLVENRGANAIYCSPSSTVTTDTGFKVSAGGWRSFPYVPVWCIAETASQAGTGTDRTLVWVSNA